MKSPSQRHSLDRTSSSGLGLIALGVLALALLAGCGSAEGEPVELSDAQKLGGVYTVDAAFDSSGPIDLGEPPTVSIDTEFGTLRIDAGCNDHFGSFTLADDGLASFTIAGQTNTPCDAATEMTDRRLITAFAEVNSWSQNDEVVELIGNQTIIALASN